MKLGGLLLAVSGLVCAQVYTDNGPNAFSASVRPTDMAFPHMAIGGGWETTIVIVNMGATTVSFTQSFYDVFGSPLPVTLRTVPDNQVITTSVASGQLPPGGSFNVVLFDRGQSLQTGWSMLSYDSTSSRLGGYSIFRLLSGGTTRSTDFEALVPLSSVDDYKFFMPFDNRQGFVTSMAVLNPGVSDSIVTFRILDSAGRVLGTHTLPLGYFNQTAFVLTDQFPETRGTTGAIYVESSTTRLSGLGFRFNAGLAFATIPIMNWSGMFP